MLETFSISEAAAALMGPGPDGTAATVEPRKVEWLRRRLNGESRPHLRGYKVARQWRMTDEDIAEAIEALRLQRRDPPPVPNRGSLTPTSYRRLHRA
jgi:hypothetical protein